MTEDGSRRSVRVVSHPVPGPMPTLAPREGAHPSPADLLLPSAAADRLRLPGALAVTTGQQPGLFGGPMYVVHKALAARAVARCLERAWERPVVPVFWLAGDDHDWDEASHTAWWSREDEVVRWALPARDTNAPQEPMSAVPLPWPDVVAARERLAGDLPPGQARDAALAWIDRHWHRDATVHSAFTTAIAELLEPLGIACLDATAAPIKQAQRPLLRAALEQADQLDAALAALPAQDAWTGAGEGLTLVFLEASAGRDRLVLDGEAFRTRRSGEHFTRERLYALLETEPERFSANVLLRPVVEAALLPTVAYVAGPGEHRYLTRQAAALYPVLEVTPQPPVPRWGGSVVDAVTDRLLDRLELDAEAVLEDQGPLGRLMVRRDLDPAIPAAMATLTGAIDAASAALQQTGREIDPVLERAIESRRRRLQFVATDLERLMERHHKKRDGIIWRQYQRVRTRLLPLDTRQERVIGVAAALGTWGEGWLAAAAAAADAWAAATLPLGEPSLRGTR